MVLRLLEKIYIWGNQYDKKNKIPKKIKNTFIISIGNITTGGTGKTPTTIFLSTACTLQKYPNAILTRGYKSKISKKGGILLSKKNDIQPINYDEYSDQIWGDEPLLMSYYLPNTPIGVGKNRLLNAINIHTKYRTRIFILDDGFQTYNIARDLDVVLIDATNPFGNYRCLPNGILREPLAALQRANIFIITRTNMVNENTINQITDILKKYSTDVPIFKSTYEPVGYFNITEQYYPTEIKNIKNLYDTNVIVMSAIGNPINFYETLTQMCKLNITHKIKFKDHHYYTKKDLKYLFKKIALLEVEPTIITTEKDWVKIKKYYKYIQQEFKGNFFVLKMNLEIENNHEFINIITNKIMN